MWPDSHSCLSRIHFLLLVMLSMDGHRQMLTTLVFYTELSILPKR